MNNMKFALILLLCVSPYVFPQSIQHGRVFEQNSGFTPLQGVQLDVKDATPEISDQDGRFHLQFTAKTKGQVLFVNSISKAGYLVINQKAIDKWSFAPEKELKVVMSLRSKFEQNLREYYRIGYKNYKERYDSILVRLRSEKERNILNEKEYKKTLDSISNGYKSELETLDYYADIFARINKDELKGVDRIAIRLVDEGKLDSAIAVYEKERLHEKFINQWKSSRILDAEIKAMIPSMQHYADMCAFAGGKENFNNVDKILGLIAAADTTNYNYVSNYYNFLLRQKQYKKAIAWGERLLNLCKDEDDKPNIIGTLGVCYVNMLDIQKGEKMIREAQEIMDAFIHTNIDKKLLRWSESFLSLIAFYKEFLTMKDPSLYDVLVDKFLYCIKETQKKQKILVNSDYDFDFLFNSAYAFVIPSLLSRGDVVKAKACYEFLTQFYKDFNYTSKSKIREETLLLGEVANVEIYYAKEKKEQAKKYFEVLEVRFQKLYNKNPDLYVQSYLQYLCYWAECLCDLNKFDETQDKVDKALDIIVDINLKEQGVYLSGVIYSLFRVAKNIYSRRDVLDKQELIYEKMRNFYDLFLPVMLEVMIEDMEWYGIISDYTDIEMRLGKPEKAKAFIVDALYHLEGKTQNENNINYRIQLYYKLGNTYHVMENDSACIYYEKSKSLCDRQMKNDKNKYLKYKIISVNALGRYYREVKSNDALALKIFDESLSLSKQVNTTDSISLIGDAEVELGNTYWHIGDLDQREKHFRKAIVYNKLELELRQEKLVNNHPDIALSCEIIGNLYSQLEDYNSARDYFEQALRIYTTFFKDDHISILIMNNQIGYAYLGMQQYEQALQYFSDALAMATHYYPKGHLGTAEIYDNMSKAYLGQGNLEKALESLECMVKLYIDNGRKNDYYVADAYFNMSAIYSVYKDYRKAINNCLKAKEIFEALCDEGFQYNGNLSQVLGDMSYYSIFEQKFSEAENYSKQALKIDPAQTWIKTNLMMALFFQQKYKEAEKVYEEMKDKIMENDKSFKEVMIEDIKEYEEAKIVPPSVLKEIEKLKVRLKQ